MTEASGSTGRFTIGDWLVEPELDRISRESKSINLRSQVMEVLVYLARNRGRVVSLDELLEDLWAGKVVTDGAVYNSIAELRNALCAGGDSDAYIETIPKKGYRLTAPVTGLDAEHGLLDKEPRSKRYLAAVFALIVVAIIVVWPAVSDLNWSSFLQRAPEISIAVLPFEDLSASGDQVYFTDGISEEVLNALAHIPELRVISRSSSFSFRGRDVHMPTLAEQLGVNYVLEGSVRKSGDNLRITAQLIDALADEHVWSKTFDTKQFENIFAVQEEISLAVVGELEQRLGLQTRAKPRVISTASQDAHNALLLGRHLLVEDTVPALREAVGHFENAITLDPDYALAHAELAMAIPILQAWDPDSMTEEDAEAKSRWHAERAMTLDPSLAEAHAATAWIFESKGEWEEALTMYRQAIQINSNYANAYSWMGDIVDRLYGHHVENFALTEKAHRLDPLSPDLRDKYISMLTNRNRLADAERELDKWAAISPAWYATERGRLASVGGRTADATLGYLEGLQIEPESWWRWVFFAWELAMLGLEGEVFATEGARHATIFSMMGRPEAAVRIAEENFAADPTARPSRNQMALALAGAGNYDRAQPFLEDLWLRANHRASIKGGPFGPLKAAALIAARRAAGDHDSVGEILEAMRKDVEEHREAGMNGTINIYWHVDFNDGLASYLSGERERGLALIERAVRDGYHVWSNVAYLQELYDDPGFERIRLAQEARVTRERRRFLAVVCNDNPYADIWQPLEETCEGFFATASDSAPVLESSNDWITRGNYRTRSVRATKVPPFRSQSTRMRPANRCELCGGVPVKL